MAPHTSDTPTPLLDVTFDWADPEPDHPALDVLIRLTALTDRAQDDDADGAVTAYLMEPEASGRWRRTLRLPADLRTSYQLCPVRDRGIRGRRLGDRRWMEVLGTGVPDPHAPTSLPPGCVYGNAGFSSVLELPEALSQPWVNRRPGVAAGTMVKATFGDGQTQSVISLWTPPAMDVKATDLPLVVVFDGAPLRRCDISATFENLVADLAVPPFVAVLVESIHGSAERGPTRIRSLTQPDQFVSFVLDDLLPHLAQTQPVTSDPSRTVVVGQSLGGLAAAHLGAAAPERFGNVVGQSSALWWPGDEDGGLSGEAVITSYRQAARPVRFFLEAGTEEGSLLAANHRFREVLDERGYDVLFREYRGGHDYACWRGGLADALVLALGTPASAR
jgi:enterochelin esterase-like enzyme